MQVTQAFKGPKLEKIQLNQQRKNYGQIFWRLERLHSHLKKVYLKLLQEEKTLNCEGKGVNKLTIKH